ncbi:MAG: shikimate dehydrogenase [Spirochaetaceae bacterium]
MKEQNFLDNLVGVFGHPASENPGVVIQEAAFKDLGLERWRFLTVDVDPDKLEDAITGLKAMKMRGINCTLPHKIEVLKYIDEISPSAKLIGAVNTIVNNNGKLFGDNTDGKGFMESLKDAGISPKGKNIVILGAGGAGRAISVELALAGAQHITIVNIPQDEKMANSLIDVLNNNTDAKAEYRPWIGDYKVPADTNIFINATPIGLYPNINDKPNVDYSTIRPDLFVQDVIPNPAFTPFLDEAKKRGARWNTGMGMLINQAAININMWTGKDPDKKVMAKAFQDVIG